MRLDGAAEPLGEALRPRQVGFGQDDDELLAAPARDGVPLSRERGEKPAHRPQHHVASGMAEGVVDVLETVEVEQHERKLVVEALGTGDLGGQDLLERATVRQPG